MSVFVVCTDVSSVCGEYFSGAGEVDVVVVVVCPVVVGCEDEREEFLLPHVATNFVEDLGTCAVESRGPASHHAIFLPCGAVVPVLDGAVLGTRAGVEGGDVNGFAEAVIAEFAAACDFAAVVGAEVHDFGDATVFEVVAESREAHCQFAAHGHFDALFGPDHVVNAKDRGGDADGLRNGTSLAGTRKSSIGVRDFDEVDAPLFDLVIAAQAGGDNEVTTAAGWIRWWIGGGISWGIGGCGASAVVWHTNVATGTRVFVAGKFDTLESTCATCAGEHSNIAATNAGPCASGADTECGGLAFFVWAVFGACLCTVRFVTHCAAGPACK